MLKGKTAVITGCLRGIGRTTMDMFAENGANIFACAQMEDEEFSDVISNDSEHDTRVVEERSEH